MEPRNALVRDVIGRLRGSGRPERNLILGTHYDAWSFGGVDPQSANAVLLEVARALQAGTPPYNDVILLFDDGEEQDYLGGYAFARSHSWIEDVQYVIGLDTAAWGPVILLQTTPRNSNLINKYARAVSNTTAFGFFADADWNIIHDTSEIQPFYERGIPGLALEDPTAFAGKHSDQDRIDFVKPGSLQQMGDQTLSLARYIGNLDLSQSSPSSQSYFTLFKIGVVHYPTSWNIILALFSALGLGILIALDIQRKIYTYRLLFLSIPFFILAIFGAALFGLVMGKGFTSLFPNTNPNTGSYLHPASLSFFLASIVIVALAFFVVRGKIVKAFGATAVTRAGLLVWLVFSAISAVLLPVGSYIFSIPLTTSVIAHFLPSRLKFLKIIPAIIATVLFAPNIVLIFLGAGMIGLVLVTILEILIAELW